MDQPVAAPATAPRPRLFSAALLAAAAVLLMIAGSVYWYLHSPYGAFVGLRYVAGPFEERALYEIGWLGKAHTVALDVPGKVVSYVRAGSHEAAMTIGDDGMTSVYSLDSGSSEPIASGALPKAALALSPDGAYLAYAERTGTSTDASDTADMTPPEFYERSAWSVVLYRTDDGERAVLGSGYAPQFFSRDGTLYLLWETNDYLHISAVVTNTNQDIPIDLGSSNGLFALSVSPDGRYVALPQGIGYGLFELEHQDGTFTLQPSSRALMTDTTTAKAWFTSDALDIISTGTGNAAILTRYPLSDFAHARATRELAPVPIITLTP